MQSKRILVTGANSGIGLALARRLAGEGHEVFMLCRSMERGQNAVDEILKEQPRASLRLIQCDLASLQSIRQTAEEIGRKIGSLDVLVNNAGVILPGRRETADGFELQFGVNHLGHFLLTLLLLPLLQKGKDPRIVIVSSGAHKAGKMYFDAIHLENNFSIIRAYSRSKLANLLFGFELARRLEEFGIMVNCLHPGAVGTNIGINRETGFGKGIMALLRPFFRSTEKGADTAWYLAVSPEVNEVTGKYFIDRKIQPSSEASTDLDLQARLWSLSEEMTGIRWEDVSFQ